MLPSVFVSYSHKDNEFARQLVNDLRPRVRSVWFDETNIEPGRRWDDEIEQGIKNADVVLLVLSPNLLASQICHDEFDFADRYSKPIIPLLIAHCNDKDMWLRVARRQWIDFRSDHSTAFDKLLKSFSHLGNYRIPLDLNCPVCNTSSEVESRYCSACGCAYQPIHLGELYGLPPAALQAYLRTYQPRTILPNTGADDLMTVALTQFVLGSFDMAASLLERVIQTRPTYGYAWYALSLVGLRGRRPRLLDRDEAILAQTRALKSVQNDATQSHAFLLLALVKEDYFKAKGFSVERPAIAECRALASIGQTTKMELRALLAFVPVPAGNLVEAIRAVANA